MLYGGSFSHHDSGVHAQDFPTGWFDPFCEFTGMLMQGHPMDLFLKISVLQAHFCWLGDVEEIVVFGRKVLLGKR